MYVQVDADELPEDAEEFYDHQLIGLRAITVEGNEVGEVADVRHGAGQDLLVIETAKGEVLVPFVSAIVPEIDLAAGSLTIADRPGLLDPEAAD